MAGLIVVTSSPGFERTSSLEPSGGREPVAVPIESHELSRLVVSELVPAIAFVSSPRTDRTAVVTRDPSSQPGHLTGMRTKLPSQGPPAPPRRK